MKKEFIQDVLGQVKFKEAHEEIEKELSNHMEEMGASLSEFIKDPKVLEGEVVKRMGLPRDVGMHLNEVHKPKWDWVMIAAVCPLILSGLYMLTPYGWMPNHILWVGLGVVLARELWVIKPKTWVKYSAVGFITTAIITLASFASSVWMDGQPYIYIDGIGINIKIIDLSSALFALFAPGILMKTKSEKKYSWAWLPLISVPFWFYTKTGSLFPLVSYGAALFGMIVVSQLSLLRTLAAVLLTVLSFSIWTNTAVSEVKVVNSHTDSALRSIYQTSPELALFAVACGILLCLRLFELSQKIKMTQAKISAVGIASYITLNIVWGTLANFGYAPMPTAGLNFPFVSYGGSLMIAQLGMMGLILGFYKRKNLTLT